MRPLALVLVLAVQVSAQTSKPLSDAEVNSAIVLGKANKIGGLDFHCAASKVTSLGGFAGLYGVAVQAAINSNRKYDVDIYSSRGWIARSAWQATQQQKPFTLADVPSEWRDPAIRLTVSPDMPDSGDDAIIPAAIQNVTFKAETPIRTETISLKSPLSFEMRTWKNAAGATVDYQFGTAVLDYGKLNAFNSQHDLTLVVSTEAGDRHCEVRKGTIGRLLKATK